MRALLVAAAVAALAGCGDTSPPRPAPASSAKVSDPTAPGRLAGVDPDPAAAVDARASAVATAVQGDFERIRRRARIAFVRSLHTVCRTAGAGRRLWTCRSFTRGVGSEGPVLQEIAWAPSLRRGEVRVAVIGRDAAAVCRSDAAWCVARARAGLRVAIEWP